MHEIRWPDQRESRAILADYCEQHEVPNGQRVAHLPEDPDPGCES